MSNIIQPLYSHYIGLPDESTLFNPLTDTPAHLREQDELTEFYKLCNEYYSPEFGIKYLLATNLYPFQMATIRAILGHKFPLILFTRGGGKTFMLAVYAVYHALMFPGQKIVLVSASFRQSKLIFSEIQKIYDRSPLLRMVSEDKPRISTDNCHYHLMGSTIKALPLGTGDKIRGERGHVILADEFNCCRKCLVQTDLGLQRIDDLVENFKPGDEPVSIFTADNAQPIEKPDRYIRTPDPVDVYKVLTVHGYGFECSEKHQVMTSNGWKLAKDLTNKDYLLLESSDYFPEKRIKTDRIEVNENIAWAMGFLVAEGSINSNHTISCCSVDINPIEKMRNILESYTQNKVSIYEREAQIDHRGWDCKKRYDLSLCDIELRKRLEHLGLKKCKANEKLIPWSILQSPKEIVISFLSGLFEGDGSAFVFAENGNDNVLRCAYYSVNEELCEQVQTILLKFGIICNKRIRDGNKNPQCMLTVNGLNAIKLFKLLNIKKWNDKIDIDNVYAHSKRKSGVIYKRRGKFQASTNNTGKKINVGMFNSRDQAQAALDIFIENMPHYVKVKSVTLLSEKEILYDFHLPQTHSFMANGFRQHNSIPIEIFDVVVRGFAATESDPWMKTRDRLLKEHKEGSAGVTKDDAMSEVMLSEGNKVILSGTAGFKGGTFYQVYKQYLAIIRNGVKGKVGDYSELFSEDIGLPEDIEVDAEDYCITKYTYLELPLGMQDIKVIQNAKQTMPGPLFEMEYMAEFADDSLGFFKPRDIEAATCRPGTGFSVKTKGVENRHYIMGVDPAKTHDRFAIIIMEVGTPNKIIYCWTMKDNERTYSTGAKKIRELLRQFNIQGIAMDEGGGGLAVEEMLNFSEFLESGDIKIYRNDDETTEAKEGKKMLHMFAFNSTWLDDANALLQKNIEDKLIMFPRLQADDTLVEESFAKHDDAAYEIIELKRELVSIDVTYSKTGKKQFNLAPPDPKKDIDGIVRHKDRYSALLLCNYLASRFEKINYDELDHSRKIFYESINYGGWVDDITES